jgi:serine carboxypeptidase-like clade 4
MASSSFCHPSPSFVLLLLTLPFLSATSPNNHLHLSSTASFPRLQAEKLIRDLNLFPKDPINTAPPDPSFVAPKIVEKRFNFPHLHYSGPSSEELGHHAGYYRLPHSKSARYVRLQLFTIFHEYMLIGFFFFFLFFYYVNWFLN